MSGREWKPGDVAMVRGGGFTSLALRTVSNSWVWIDLSGKNPVHGACFAHESGVTEARPLVVLDPEDREQVARLADAFCSARWSHQPGSEECDPLTRSTMKEALDAYLAPPKPDEPTRLGAVVEDADGLRWLRDEGISERRNVWYCHGQGASRKYADITAVRVLSEGVTP